MSPYSCFPMREVWPSSTRKLSVAVRFKHAFRSIMAGCGRSEAERLLWRAGFGPKRGKAAQLARLGLSRAVDRLVYPPKEKLTGPKPRDDKGRKLSPKDAWGRDGLWRLDRMVRTRRPLV